MIIRIAGADTNAPSNTSPTSAWQAVERIQRTRARTCMIVTQPDHASLAGDFASLFDGGHFPGITPEVIGAIRLHDEGWARFEGSAADLRTPPVDLAGIPLSFLDVPPETFLKAWSGSITAASSTGPTGEFIVSEHFKSLARYRREKVVDPPETAARIDNFIVSESERQESLLAQTHLTRGELAGNVKLLQFCDLLSLAVCAGVQGAVEFPYDFGRGRIRLSASAGLYQLSPSPFPNPARFEIPVIHFTEDAISIPPPVPVTLR